MAYGHVKIYLLQECLANEWNSQKKKKQEEKRSRSVESGHFKNALQTYGGSLRVFAKKKKKPKHLYTTKILHTSSTPAPHRHPANMSLLLFLRHRSDSERPVCF